MINLEVGSFFKAYDWEGVELDETEEDLKGKYVIITIVCLVFGYMIAFSYRLTESQTSEAK